MKNKLKLVMLLAVGVMMPLQAHGDLVVTASEIGGDVVFAGSGSIDLTGLIFEGIPPQAPGGLDPDDFFLVGPTALTLIDVYGGLTGPGNIGTGTAFFAPTSGSGDRFGIDFAEPILALPDGYISGSLLSGTSTFGGQTFASLGLTEGTYVWSSASTSVTLNIVGSAVPEPAGFAALMIAGLAVGVRRCR